MAWTNEQYDAITEKDCNLLVAAAAGAGKTAVLVERIIRKITEDNNPIDIDRLLIVTFTNAAATEMRERIAEAISACLEKNPGSTNIQRQLTLLGKASITTIHSFCLEVIRSNFQNINIDPGFRIADDTESTLMKIEAMNELFEEQYETENTDFLDLLECYGGNKDDQALQDMVLDLFSFVQSSPWPEEWLYKMTENLNVTSQIDFSQTQWGKVILSSALLELKGVRETLSRMSGELKFALGLEKYYEIFLEDIDNINRIIGILESDIGNKWDALYSVLGETKFSTLRCAKETDKEKQEAAKKIRDEAKARVKRLSEKLITGVSEDCIRDIKVLYPRIKTISSLVIDLMEKYASKKSAKSIVDFNDLEHLCLQILTNREGGQELQPSEAALLYRERFEEILVDEYQDSNLVQEIIINMISRLDSGKPNVFMVGDVKQSIYRFRQARPELFLEKYNTYSTTKGDIFRKIQLFKNFRSRREVVDAVNFIFKQVMSVSVGELDYTDDEALNPGAVYLENDDKDLIVGGEAEFHLIQTGKDLLAQDNADLTDAADENGAENDEMLDNMQCEARVAARRILELMKPDKEGRQFYVFDKLTKCYRGLKFSDIVVLLRTTSNWSDIFTEEFSMMGIPAFADTGSGFFKTVEVQVIMSLLQIIDNPLQDIPLLSVLRSPIVSFTTDDLAELRLADKKAAIYDAMKKLAAEEQGDTSQKSAAFLHQLEKWRGMSLHMSTDRLIWQLYDDTGYYGMVGAMPSGEQRQANLRILFERARQFEQTSYKGLFNFVNFIDRLKTGKGDMGSAKILGENDNVVRIMSIHKSKGLEFPVVILSGCGKKFNLQDMNKGVLLHQELGFGPDVVDYMTRVSWPSAAKQAIREKIKTETLSEEMRILYVALTRSREKLIITGIVNDAEKVVTKWFSQACCNGSKLPDYEILKGNNYLDWIGPALIRHKGCGELRNYAASGNEYKGQLIDDSSKWIIKKWDKNDIKNSRAAEKHDESGFLQWLEALDGSNASEYADEVSRRMSWEYSFSRLTNIPAKLSVTEIKRRYNTTGSEDADSKQIYLPSLVKKPAFLEEKKGLSAAEKGTVLHFVMQHLDFNNLDIASQIQAMVTKDLLTMQQAQSVDIERISRFFNSQIGKRLLSSSAFYREVPFNIEIPCTEVYPDMKVEYSNESILLQGVIDCYFEEQDRIILLDYKTDFVPQGGEDAIRDRYRLQLSYYARALEMLTGKRVAEKYIYMFWNCELLEIE